VKNHDFTPLILVDVDGVHLKEDAKIKYAVQVRMAVKCGDFRV
jgi:hypothetical protein